MKRSTFLQSLTRLTYIMIRTGLFNNISNVGIFHDWSIEKWADQLQVVTYNSVLLLNTEAKSNRNWPKKKTDSGTFQRLSLTHDYSVTGHTSLLRGHTDQTRAPIGEAAVSHMSLTCRERPGLLYPLLHEAQPWNSCWQSCLSPNHPLT